MRLITRVAFAASIALLTLGQDACQNAPSYRQPDHEGTAPPAQPPLRTWSVWKAADPQNDHPCGENQFTFGVVRDGVTCNASFDFTPLYQQAIAQRDAILRSTTCPGRCTNRYVVDNGVIKSCERDNTQARLRLESALHCLPNVATFPPSIVPNPLPPGPRRITSTVWNPRMLYEEPFGHPPPPATCEEQIRVIYREKVDSCDAITSYRRYVDAAKREALRRQLLLPCASGCEKRLPIVFDYIRWDCENGEVIVEVVLKPCRMR